MPKDDLINKLGARTSTDSSNKTTLNVAGVTVGSTATDGTNRGQDMLGSGQVKTDTTVATVTSTVETKETNTASSKVEPSGSTTTQSDPNDWTLDNALKEIKKLREENKATRVKYAESIEALKSESDTRVTAKEQELQDLVVKAKELEEIKAKEEDRKRDLSEKLSHRESLIADLKAKLEVEKKLFEEKHNQLQNQVNQYKAESEAQLEVYKERLGTELSNIPEKYKDIANYIVKGAGDPRDALVALNEAKLRGLFEDKTVVVSHSVPGASQGARATKESLDSAVQAQREKLSSMEKIREGLRQVRSGEGNSAFRTR